MANVVIHFIVPLSATTMLLLFLRLLLENRMRWWTAPLLALVMNVIIVPKILYTDDYVPSAISNLVGAGMAMVAIPLIFFQGKWWKKLLLNLYFWTLLMLCDLLFSSYFIPQLGSDLIAWPTQKLLAYTVGSLMLYSLLGSLSVLFLRRLAIRQFQPFYLLYLLFPVSLWMMAYGHLFKSVEWLWLPGVLICMGSQIALLVYTLAQERRSALEQELKDVRRVMELEQAHYRLLDVQQEELARLRHDFNNHLAAIRQLISAGEEADAQQMIGEVAAAVRQTGRRAYCGIPVVNAVLEEKEELCRCKEIDLDISLDLPALCRVEAIQLCSIFSNLLDNAIHGAECSAGPGLWIQLRSKVDGDYLFIRTRNPAPASPEKPLPGHGYGSRILSSLAEQYGGSYRTDYQNGIYTAVLSLAVQ